MASLPLLLLPVCLMLRQKLPRLIDEVKKLPRQMPLQHIQHPVDVLQQPVGKAPSGKVNDVKLSFKYGHNQFGPAVSVSYPWGVSFGLDGAETIFQPDEIVYNDFATVK